MLYTTCPTCGYFIAQKTLEYEEKKQNICANPNLSNEEKEKKLSELLLSLKLRRYCCKMRVMSYKRLVYDILPIPKEN
jgi:DNA-directed RNA polymerase subunit N (RpoN/RPB10)